MINNTERSLFGSYD